MTKEFKKVFFTTKQFNNLIGGNKNTLKDLYNYNHLKPEKNPENKKQFFYTCYEAEKITNNNMLENFYNIPCIIILNNRIVAWNGKDFSKADLRTCTKTCVYTKIQVKKYIAESNRNKEIKYICVCDIKYDPAWYNKKYNSLFDASERVPFKQLKTYCKQYGGTSFLQSNLKNGGIMEIYPETPATDFTKSIDKSGYLKKPVHDKYKKILSKYEEKRENFVKSFIEESRESYFNINNNLCYHITTPLQYYFNIMKLLNIKKVKCNSAGLSYTAETKKYIFSWVEESFIIVLKEQPKNKNIKYYFKNIYIKLNFYMVDNITNETLKEIKNIIHSNKLFYIENNEGLTACDTYVYNTCYEMNNIKIIPTYTEENNTEKITEIIFNFRISKNQNIKYFNSEAHEEAKKVLNAVTL